MSTNYSSISRLSRRQMLKAMGMAGTGLVLAACAPGGAPSSDGGGASGEAVEIVYHTRTGVQEEFSNAELEFFHADNEGITVKVEATPNAEYQQKLATLAAAAAGMLSTDGRCKTLDARANGYVRSEAAGALVLLLGEFVLTLAVHIPKNNALAAYASLGSADDAATWAHYYTTWTRWNHVRMLASMVTVILLSSALHKRGERLATIVRPTQM